MHVHLGFELHVIRCLIAQSTGEVMRVPVRTVCSAVKLKSLCSAHNHWSLDPKMDQRRFYRVDFRVHLLYIQ